MGESWSSERIKALAELVGERSLHSRNEASSWRRWALASCLSINGGAVIAMLNLASVEIDQNSRSWALIWFVGGMVASIIYGFVAAAALASQGAYFRQSSWTLHRKSEGDEVELDAAQLERLRKLDMRIQWIQYLALPFFLIGLCVGVDGLK